MPPKYTVRAELRIGQTENIRLTVMAQAMERYSDRVFSLPKADSQWMNGVQRPLIHS